MVLILSSYFNFELHIFLCVNCETVALYIYIYNLNYAVNNQIRFKEYNVFFRLKVKS